MNTLSKNAIPPKGMLASWRTSKQNKVRSHVVLSETLFREALMRERKRADRLEVPFVLVRICLRATRARRFVYALSKTAIEADLIGWLDEGKVLGLLRSLDDAASSDNAASICAVLQQTAGRCLPLADAQSCSITVDVYSPHSESHHETQDRLGPVTKRLLDIVASTAFLIAFSPVFLIVASLVKLTSAGPVFFRQQRLGEAGRPFLMLKFRTMHVNADHKIHQQYVEKFIETGGKPADDKNVVFKIVNDPRVTPVGHFLRRLSLDEFPQFWNVLTGEMSLVGPRPPLPYEVARYKGWHWRRVVEAKPGITGLWQVEGRSRTTFDEMVRMDLRYVKNCSLWTDLKILLATPRAVISGKGAH